MKKAAAILLTLIASIAMLIPTALAADTILPQGAENFTDAECMTIISSANNDDTERAAYMANTECTLSTKNPCREEFLSCGIKTGDIHLWMLPYYITYIIEFLIGVAGLISVLFVIVGGYYYAWGGVTEDKEKGKKAVMYALIGLALASLAWIIVNIIQTQLTS